ncbi:hypothetical protein B0T24DRAFT_643650 [Lasiosphaeria ovina]|uniref:Uncharacterized protein n=1 Tax=Lasiosphaeria ovina TaxID=92902 RepID=A0AAE0JS76_9PEZI|nr:hypothetical protein B0T24DRAFT_643650 [Lasiosphaeria ovina]
MTVQIVPLTKLGERIQRDHVARNVPDSGPVWIERRYKTPNPPPFLRTFRAYICRFSEAPTHAFFFCNAGLVGF